MTKVLFKKNSDNRKIGADTAFTYSEKSTCPDNCQLKNNGCYADGWPVTLHWNSVSSGNTPNHYEWEDFILQLRALPKRKLFRYGVAGDLPGTNNRIDTEKLNDMVKASSRIRGFAFTHKPVGFGNFGESMEMLTARANNTKAIKDANENGFCINLSADNIQQADHLFSLKIAPVVCVVPDDAPDRFKTPEGNHVIVCLNEKDENMTCDKCGLCSVSSRKAIIAFRAHGNRGKKVSNRIREQERVYLNVVAA